ncbi:hypothetical protein [Phenylobacterium sp.]|uniref:hypothetical protein n=1 Tax=Phenylobacterium sp. TaxID=1871053 RepID=UPI003BAD7F7A
MQSGLRYNDILIDLEVEPPMAAALADALDPFFEWAEPSGDADVSLSVSAAPPAGWTSPSGDGEAIVVDASLYPHLRSDGRRWPLPGGAYLIRIEATGSLALFNRPERRIALWNPQFAPCVLDAARLIKGLATARLEQRGAVQLHCSGVIVETAGTPPTAVLLMGDSRQGKTTILLELLKAFRVRQLSCDTVVIGADGSGALDVRGWPSPFSASHGTLADHPQLHDFVPTERRNLTYDGLWRDGHKAVLDARTVAQRFGGEIVCAADRIATFIILRFAPDQPTGVWPVRSERAFAAAMHSYYLGSRDPIYPNWHGYFTSSDMEIDRNISRIAALAFSRCQALEMVWAPGPESLLKRVWPLGEAHATLSTLMPSPETLARPDTPVTNLEARGEAPVG